MIYADYIQKIVRRNFYYMPPLPQLPCTYINFNQTKLLLHQSPWHWTKNFSFFFYNVCIYVCDLTVINVVTLFNIMCGRYAYMWLYSYIIKSIMSRKFLLSFFCLSFFFRRSLSSHFILGVLCHVLIAARSC